MVYMGGPDGVWGLDAQSGAVEWHYFTGAMVGSSPAVLTGAQNGSTLYVGCEDGYLYARLQERGRGTTAGSTGSDVLC